jgi:ABC-type transporter Mla MlaB component
VWVGNGGTREVDPMPEYDVAERAGDYVLLRLGGEWLEGVPLAQIHRELEEHYVDDGVRRIRADVSQVSRISLEGVAALLHLNQEAKRRGKSFLLENATGQPRTKLAETGVLRYLSEDV